MGNNICLIPWDRVINFMYWVYPYAIGYLYSIFIGDFCIGKLMEDGYKMKKEQKNISHRDYAISDK